MITITLDQTTPIAVGGYVSGRAVWMPNAGQKARAVKMAVRWRTEGRGTMNKGEVWTTNLPLTAGMPLAPVTIPFNVTLPPDGPVSYNGNLIRIIWEVRMEIDEPLKKDEFAAVPFVVIPRYRT